MATTELISQTGVLRAAVATDLMEVESTGGVSAHVLASSLGGLMPNGTLTLAQMADMATARILGRTTAGAGAPEALTAAQATALLNAFTSALAGLVPASGGGTTNFLRADGTWASPANAPLEVQTANNSAALNFTQFSSTYSQYRFELDALLPVSSPVELGIQMSVDGGATYLAGTNYTWVHNTAIAGASGPASANNTSDIHVTDGNRFRTGTGISLSGTIWLSNMLNASLYAQIHGIQTSWDSATGPATVTVCGVCKNVSCNAVRILATSGNLASGVIRMYGIPK